MKERFISGIYNYCDRWCERCTFTSRCRNYEGTSKLSNEQLDVHNKAFWDNISSNFDNAIKLLQKAAKKHGIDLNKPMTEQEEAEYKERRSFIRKASQDHALSKLCKEYQKTVRPFILQSDDFANKTNELSDHVQLGIKSEEDAVQTVAGIGDCFEIIQWYLFFIDAKLQRALLGKMEDEGEETDDGYQKDSDGSAKIAIIAIERSIVAWTKLYEQLPTSEDVSLNALSLLSRLKQKAMEEFPQALEFKRPGFDE